MGMENEDLEFLAEIVEKSHWLMYGDLDGHIDAFAWKVFQHELKDWGFGDVEMKPDFAVAYWLFISELVALDLVEYGTSPRGAWLTERGERFKKLVLSHDKAIAEANDYIYKKYNS